MKGPMMTLDFVTYDGTPEALPKHWKAILVHDKETGFFHVNMAIGGGKGLWGHDYDDIILNKGDRWAYLPTNF
jgi:hypothetical protein